jgi:type IV pilus assembly protein PilX
MELMESKISIFNLANHQSMHKQQGVVLVVALVFLVALTAVAGALMQTTTSDMKMSGASQEKTIATQESISAIDQVVFGQINVGGANNGLAQPLSTFAGLGLDVSATVSAKDTTATILDATPNSLVVDCPHSQMATSVQVFKCNALLIQITRSYGRNKASTIQVSSGVSQQLLP